MAGIRTQEYTDGTGMLFEHNLRFPGQYYDEETGLHYNYFRTYDSSTGRYLESDPIGLWGGLNSYGYVGSNPLSAIDPLGLVEWNGYIVNEGIGAGITTNFFNWYLESKCFEGE
jgi:RHS repeat-associated protein